MAFRESGVFTGTLAAVLDGALVNGDPWTLAHSELRAALFIDTGYTVDFSAHGHYHQKDWVAKILPRLLVRAPGLRFAAQHSSFTLTVNGHAATMTLDQNYRDVTAMAADLNSQSVGLSGSWTTENYNLVFTGAVYTDSIVVADLVDPIGGLRHLSQAMVTDGSWPDPTEVSAGSYSSQPVANSLVVSGRTIGLVLEPTVWTNVSFAADGALVFYGSTIPERTLDALAFVTFGHRYRARNGTFRVTWPSPLITIDTTPSIAQIR